ncbi:MAG: hypothetical protein GKR89_25970 [Candidatus Latescibacteria bacterium]|nr:hypothetical protein [Candidatus Latescibacterota bacterium]
MAYSISDPFVRLTWDDVERWAGAAVVERGRAYQRQGRVTDLGRTQEGALLAWVQGTQRYTTRLTIQARKQLASECTCPYWTDCKHGVAVVLAYLQAVKEGQSVPTVPPWPSTPPIWKPWRVSIFLPGISAPTRSRDEASGFGSARPKPI